MASEMCVIHFVGGSSTEVAMPLEAVREMIERSGDSDRGWIRLLAGQPGEVAFRIAHVTHLTAAPDRTVAFGG